MSLLFALIIGGIIGWLAAALAGRDEGLFGSVAIGVVGAIIGSFLSNLFRTNGFTFGVTWPGLLWTFIGALILSILLNTVQHRKSHVR